MKTAIRTMPMTEMMVVSDSCDSIWNHYNSSVASTTAVKSEDSCLIVMLPNVIIHSTETGNGMSGKMIGSSRAVRPQLALAMNMTTKDDQLIQHAQ